MFDVMVITHKGMALLAASTAQDKLVIDGCDADATVLDATNAGAVVNRPSNPISTTTNVTLLAANSTSIFTRATFLAGQNNGGNVNTFYLYGHLQSAANDKFVVAVVSDSDSVHLPEQGDLINSYGCEFEIQYSHVNDTVQVVGTANYVTLAEFNVLKERTVTTHKEGDNSTGDNQTIRGDKTFVGHLVVTNLSEDKSSSMYHNGIYYEDGGDELAGMKGDVSTSYGTAALEIIAGDVSDTENHTKLRITHANNDDSYNGFHFFINSEDETVASIYYNNDLSDYEFYATNVGADNLRLANSLSFSNGVEFVVNQNDLNMGSDANPVGTLTAANVKAPQGALVSVVEFDTGKFNYTDTKYLTNYSNDDLYIISRYNTNNVSVEKLLFYNYGYPNQDTTDPLTDGKVVLTKVSGNTHTINVAGAISQANVNDDTLIVPIGSFVMAFISTTIVLQKEIGEAFSVSAPNSGGDVVCNYAAFSNLGWGNPATPRYLPAGTYKAFGYVSLPANKTSSIPLLLQRVS